MRFVPTSLRDAFLVELDPRVDERGFFARFFCSREFAEHGLETSFPQINTSLSVTRGTLRGLHYQLPPSAEVKIVRCVAGALWDVILDIRPDSPTYGRWFGATLSAANRTMMYVPRGFAHGFLTLTADAEALYLVSASYDSAAERGVRYDDPWHGIEWPERPSEISQKDRNWPDYDPEFHGASRLSGLISLESTDGDRR